MKKIIYNKYLKMLMLVAVTVSIILVSVAGTLIARCALDSSKVNNYVVRFYIDDILAKDFTNTSVYNNLVTSKTHDISVLLYYMKEAGFRNYNDIKIDYIYMDKNHKSWTFDDILRAKCEVADEDDGVISFVSAESFSYIFSNNLLEHIKDKYVISDEMAENVYNDIYESVLAYAKSIEFDYKAQSAYSKDGFISYYEFAEGIDEEIVGKEKIASKIDLNTYNFSSCIEAVKNSAKAIYKDRTIIENIDYVYESAIAFYETKSALDSSFVKYRLKLNDDLIIENFSGEVNENEIYWEKDLTKKDTYLDSQVYEEMTMSYNGDVVYGVQEPYTNEEYVVEGHMYVLKEDIQDLIDAYDTIVQEVYGYIIMGIIGFCVFVFANIVLLIGAGHKAGEEQVVGIALDKVFLEVRAVVAFISFCLIFGILSMWFDNNGVFFSSSGVVVATGSFVINWYVLLALVLSFKRNLLKRKYIEGYSLKGNIACVRFVKFVSNFIKEKFYDASAVCRACIMFGAYLVLMAISVFLTFATESFFIFFVLMIVVNSGALLFIIANISEYNKIVDYAKTVSEGNFNEMLDASKFHYMNKTMADNMSNVTKGLNEAVKERMKSERMKTDLITNVSHDIKTPLTSIINYVDLLKKENLNNEKAKEYLDILDAKSQRLKVLIEDLIEASKLSSKVVTVREDEINFTELVYQTNGEFEEKFGKKNLNLVCKMPEDKIMITGDGRKIFRVLENIYNNVYKYALSNTRVYLNVNVNSGKVILELKNISESELNIEATELTERFVRGDLSRNTEGSGLGLSIASNIVELHKGTFEIVLDGDLFKIIITLPLSTKKEVNVLDENKGENN